MLTPKKMAVITTWTREIDEHSVPAIEGLLRDAIQAGHGGLDRQRAARCQPGNGGASRRSAQRRRRPDADGRRRLRRRWSATSSRLTGALLTATNGNVRKLVWLMNPQQKLSHRAGQRTGHRRLPVPEEIGAQSAARLWLIIESGTVPLGTVIVIDAADFVTVGGEAPRFEISDQATLHMEDTTPLAIGTAGTPADCRGAGRARCGRPTAWRCG